MPSYKLISADSHIVEPPDMYTDRIAPRLRNRAPRMERRKTPAGREYDAWMLDGQQVGTLGAVMQAGQRFEDPSQIDFLGLWEDVRKGAYNADAMLVSTVVVSTMAVPAPSNSPDAITARMTAAPSSR